ncbi:unnamed protein product [Echinostoma caproni]|uniref:Secreted protein n=1 Tax=Echinostoma caproni TaxID=27848 RepID=A0A183AR28_9TREM|nr:unnamed protein product [Echinostoma caproni]
MLWALFLMHIYWFRFIFLMAVRLVYSPQCGDIREEELDEEVTPVPSNGLKPNETTHSNGSKSICLQANGLKKTTTPQSNPMANGNVNHLKQR